MKNKFKIMLSVFIIYIIITLLFTHLYDILPIIVEYSIFKSESFYFGFITNMYSSILDFIIFTVIFLILTAKDDKRKTIQRYYENIDDCRFWKGDEATYKISGNVRRLYKMGKKSFDLSNCVLNYVKFKEMIFKDTKLQATYLNNSNLNKAKFFDCDFQGCELMNAKMRNVEIKKTNFKYVKADNATLISARIEESCLKKATFINADLNNSMLRNCDFEDANLKNCNLRRANLKGAINLTIEQLLSCSDIEYVTLDDEMYLNEEIRRRTKKNPPRSNL